MSIEQNVYDVIDLARYSKVPFLLMSNPGYGKTTIINKWAKEHNYHVEVLIGSRFTPEEIMGYQVNEPGETSLVHKNPKWYDNVMEYEAKGIPTLLFEDEVSTCPDYVQGALLDLNFSRKIGNGSKLPEDCLVMAAANYARNLPSTMGMITPNINRFCVVNLLEGRNTLDIFNEFMKPSKGAISHELKAFNKKTEEEFNTAAYEAFKDLILKYSDNESPNGYIDLENTDLGDIYQEAEGNLYNILTGRSLSYLVNVIKTMAQMGMTDKRLCYQVGAGLAGLGTNNFTKAQAERWRENLQTITSRLVVDFNSLETVDEVSLKGTVAEVIQRFLQEANKSSVGAGSFKQLKAIVNKIDDEYSDIIAVTHRFLDGDAKDDIKVAQYISDMDSIAELFEYVEGISPTESCVSHLKKIHMSNLSYYCDFTDVPLSDMNLNVLYGVDAPHIFNELRVVKLTNTERNKKRPSLYLQIAKKKAGDREINFEVNLDKATSLASVNCSATLAKDNIEEVVSFRR